MSATNRAQVITKLFKIAKKHYPYVPPVSSRSVLEHMLYACCLENSNNEAADEAFAKLEQQFFDWNEVRVTTVAELAESMKGLVDPDAASVLLKKTLHGVFETYYKFDLDFLKKENLRKTVQQFSKFRGVSPFVVSYAAQVALGGHFIPLDQAMLNLMHVCGVISEDEAAKGKVPGLERTIAKTKGIEFASVVHQMAAAFRKSPHNKDIRAIILKVAADAAERFPKRGGRKKKEEAPVEEAPAKTKATEKPAAKKATAKKATAKKATAKKTTDKKTTAKKVAEKTPVKKAAKTAKKKATTKKAVKKTTKKAAKKTTTKKAARPVKKTTKKKATVTKKAKKKTSTRSLSKKKPR